MILYSDNTKEVCPYCKGGGYILVKKSTAFSRKVYGNDEPIDYAEKCPYCNGGYAGLVEDIRNRSHLPDSYIDKGIDAFDWECYTDQQGNKVDTSKQRKFITSFIDDFDKWCETPLGLYINSKTRGSGKTFLASCISNEIMNKYLYNTKFVSASELIDISQKDGDSLKPYKECKLLVIDDLGAKLNGQDWLNDILFNIIDYRYQHKLTMIITSNIQLKNLKLDDRIESRIDKMTQNIPLPECSVRQQISNKEKLSLFKDLQLM